MQAFDMHCDTLMALRDARIAGAPKSFLTNDLHIDLQKLKKGDYMLQCMAAFVDMGEPVSPLVAALEEIDIFYEIMRKYPDDIAQVKTFADIEKNKAAGKISAMLTIEEGGACLGNLAVLRMLYELGVRMMTLTWNYKNELGFPNSIPHNINDVFPCGANTVDGLTETGIAFLSEMERLHMAIDVSHLSDAGFFDVAKHTTKPFIASHSNARAVCSHVRNLTDDMLRTFGERGCLLGINYCAAFLDEQEDETKCQSTAALMAKHMKYIQNVAGLDVLALGSDFDGIEHNLELADASYLPLLYEEMKRQGFHESEIEKVFYKNALRVFKELL